MDPGCRIRVEVSPSQEIRVSKVFDLNSKIGKIRQRFRAIIDHGMILGRSRLYFDFQF